MHSDSGECDYGEIWAANGANDVASEMKKSNLEEKTHRHRQIQREKESEGEKLWIAKRMICSQIGEKIKWYSVVES